MSLVVISDSGSRLWHSGPKSWDRLSQSWLTAPVEQKTPTESTSCWRWETSSLRFSRLPHIWSKMNSICGKRRILHSGKHWKIQIGEWGDWPVTCGVAVAFQPPGTAVLKPLESKTHFRFWKEKRKKNLCQKWDCSLAPKNATRGNPGAQEQTFDVTDCWPYGDDSSDKGRQSQHLVKKLLEPGALAHPYLRDPTESHRVKEVMGPVAQLGSKIFYGHSSKVILPPKL